MVKLENLFLENFQELSEEQYIQVEGGFNGSFIDTELVDQFSSFFGSWGTWWKDLWN